MPTSVGLVDLWVQRISSVMMKSGHEQNGLENDVVAEEENPHLAVHQVRMDDGDDSRQLTQPNGHCVSIGQGKQGARASLIVSMDSSA